MQQARMVLQGEKDRLLKFAEKRMDLAHIMRDESKDRARAILITTVFSILGMVPFVGANLLWLLTYHDSLVQALVLFVALLGVGIFLCTGSTKRALGKDRPWMFWFGVVWSQAAVVGLVMGFFMYFRSIAYFWKYDEMRSYTNVAAAQDSSAFRDGGLFLFTEDTRLDALRTVGYQSKWTGETYCVAPLVDVTMNQASDINYWAVGMNCCAPRGRFQCGDAEDSSTRSALRALEPSEVARPFMQWAMQGARYDKYLEAIRLQEATYYTKASQHPTLVYWSKDPLALKASYFDKATDLCLRLGLVYFVLLVVGCYVVAWKLIPRPQKEGVLRSV